jgi:NADPH:quinone reductase-like Zn-dependent oxidoreductase
MRAYYLTGNGIDGLELRDVADPAPLPGEVAVRVDATSINYRDLMMAQRLPNERIPLSDGAGEVVAIGDGVTEVHVGDQVAGTFFSHWVAGPITPEAHNAALGGSTDGMLSEIVVLPAHGVVPVPVGWSPQQAATLPCAALTAWNALVEGAPVMAGQTVLLLGTGGVSVFGLQFAKMMGARTIITSSSDDKLQQMKSLGADVTINYGSEPDWDKAVLDATDGVGVDMVLEVGGAGTLGKSMACTRFEGQIALIGILTGTGGAVNPGMLVGRSMSLRGVYVGSRQMFTEMNAAIDTNGLTPVIDQVFSYEQAPDAYRHVDSQTHVGKVVIAHT